MPASEAVALALKLAGQNETLAVSYATEAGLFQDAGAPSVVCGPGDIAQAHTANEWIACQRDSTLHGLPRELGGRARSAVTDRRRPRSSKRRSPRTHRKEFASAPLDCDARLSLSTAVRSGAIFRVTPVWAVSVGIFGFAVLLPPAAILGRCWQHPSWLATDRRHRTTYLQEVCQPLTPGAKGLAPISAGCRAESHRQSRSASMQRGDSRLPAPGACSCAGRPCRLRRTGRTADSRSCMRVHARAHCRWRLSAAQQCGAERQSSG